MQIKSVQMSPYGSVAQNVLVMPRTSFVVVPDLSSYFHRVSRSPFSPLGEKVAGGRMRGVIR